MQNHEQRFLQTEFWADFKGSHGWKTFFFIFDGDNVSKVKSLKECKENEKCLSVLVRSFSLKIKKFSIAYIPMSPEFSSNEENLSQKFSNELESISKKIFKFLPEDTICIRFDPALDFESLEEKNNFVSNVKKLFKQHNTKKENFRIEKTATDIQPPDTVLLSLLESEEKILSEMKSKWRYNIRLASKKGVEVKSYSAKDADFPCAFEEFFKLFMQTSERDGVQFHQKNYYLDLLNSSAETQNAPIVRLYLAKHEADVLAGIITLFCKKEAVYLYGASGNIKRNFMPAYLLQWNAICDAKKIGCPVYDFYGCPPEENKNHPMHGLFLFKTGFGGKLIHRPGSFDVVLKKNWYAFYKTAEKLRAWFYKYLKKKIAGR